MSRTAKMVDRSIWIAGVAALVAFSGSSVAAPLALPDLPLFLPESVPPLNLLVIGRDHKLYYEAYNDASDLNDDGVLDVGYKPGDDRLLRLLRFVQVLRRTTGTGFDPTV